MKKVGDESKKDRTIWKKKSKSNDKKETQKKQEKSDDIQGKVIIYPVRINPKLLQKQKSN